MSFGFGVGDFLTVYDRAKAIVDALREGPKEYLELRREVETLQRVTSQLSDDARDHKSLLNRKGPTRRKDMIQIMANCSEVLEEVQLFVDSHSCIENDGEGNAATRGVKRVWHTYQVGSADLDNMRGKLTFYTSTIDLFLDSLSIAAVGRIERKLDQVLAELMKASPQMSSASVNSISSMLSFADTVPDESAWELLKGQLFTAGVSESDIEDHKHRIINYVKGLISDALPEADAAANIQSKPKSSVSQTQVDSDKLRAILANLNLYDMRTQMIGDASVDFRIDRVQHGTFLSQPACLLVTDFWFNSAGPYQLVAGYVFMTVCPMEKKPSGAPTALEEPPLILKWAPSSLSFGSRHDGRREVGSVGSFGIEGSIRWETTRREWSVRGLKQGNRKIEWRIHNNADDTYLDCRVRLAIIVYHGMSPFYVDIERSGSLRSGLRKLTTFGVRSELETIPIEPEENKFVLDDVDTDALIVLEDGVGLTPRVAA